MNPGVMLEGLPCTHMKFLSTARPGVMDPNPVDGTIISSSPALQPQKVQSPPARGMPGVREHRLHAELAEFPAVVFGSDAEPHAASKLSAPSDGVTVLIAHFCLKRF